MSVKQKFLYTYVLLVLAYAFSTLILPPSKATLHQYHLTVLGLRAIDLTVVVLFAAIWFCAMYGFYNLVVYSNMIRKNKDGKSISNVALGIGFLSLWLPVSGIVSNLGSYLTNIHPSWTPGVGIFDSYVSLIMPLVGFIFISIGARRLSELTKMRPTLRATNVITVIVIIIGTVYVHLISANHTTLSSQYHMPEYDILLTLVAPYIYIWSIGLLSVYEIYIFRTKIGGVVYRDCWKRVSFGLGTIIVASILIQYISTLTMHLNKLSLGWILSLIYVLLIILAVGYVFIALGVRNLRKIEEV